MEGELESDNVQSIDRDRDSGSDESETNTIIPDNSASCSKISETEKYDKSQQRAINIKLHMKRIALQDRICGVHQNLNTINDQTKNADSQSLRQRSDIKALRLKTYLNKCNNQRQQQHSQIRQQRSHSDSPQQPTINSKSPANAMMRNNIKNNHNLQMQLDGVCEILNQLAIQYPQIRQRVHDLAKDNPKLQGVKIFSYSNLNELSLIKLINNNTENIMTRTRFNSQNEAKKDGGRVHQKDGRNKRANKTSETKSEAKELKALVAYINNITANYLGKPLEELGGLKFSGGLKDMETHARLLVEAGLGRIVEDEIRINRKNNRQAFITMSTDRESKENDGIVLLPVARMYAFDGDVVRGFVFNEKTNPTSSNETCGNNTKGEKYSISYDGDEVTDSELVESEVWNEEENETDALAVATTKNSPKAFVTAILKETDRREVIGSISFNNPVLLKDNIAYYKFKPYDMRVPMVYISRDSCAKHIENQKDRDVCGFLYLAQVRKTDANGHCIGELLQPVGKVGDLAAEMKAILLHNGLKDTTPYEQRFNEMYAQPDEPITAKDLINREDLRKKCIFTIDPLTARDLDDAMSLEFIGEDVVEVGVHISDVGHYLSENSELDNIVKNRATSIYLVNEVIHMLPEPLCFKCSLLPGEDKFAFSVFWRMNKDGDILDNPRYIRSVINSCSQFAYEHAQKIIDNPKDEFDIDDFPTICNGFTVEDIVQRVHALDRIAKELRKKRYENGALSINNPKIRFQLDGKTGEPLSFDVDGREDANFLIEEFMLLANGSIARFIYDHFPDLAILRNHAPPLERSIKNVSEKLAKIGIDFKYNTSKDVHESMERICKNAHNPVAMDVFLSTMLTKPMARAEYFCTAGKTQKSDLWHYALSVPFYTHFTSPIRRYPDILVHRLLAAALNYTSRPQRTSDELQQLAKICNVQKYHATSAGDDSTKLFFKRYIKMQDFLIATAVVVDLYRHNMNVVTVETGYAIDINYKAQNLLINTSEVPDYLLISSNGSKDPPRKVQLGSTVVIKLVVINEKIQAFLLCSGSRDDLLKATNKSNKKEKQQQKQAQKPLNSIQMVPQPSKKQQQQQMQQRRFQIPKVQKKFRKPHEHND